eukprot:m.79237 g.79237  ORF g.79237 m.79237 type:complete len:183 (-) comp17410_c0_seq1:115-663(-)
MSFIDPALLPKLVAFDLDDTLWSPEMEMIAGLPFRRCEHTGRVTDRANEEIQLFPDVHDILHDLHTQEHFQGVQVAYASRTMCPENAFECLELIMAKNVVSLKDLGHHFEIYPGNKTTHFQKFKEASGVAFTDMLFFDNEMRNIRDISRLGVTCVYTPYGLDKACWEKGLREHAARQKKQKP